MHIILSEYLVKNTIEIIANICYTIIKRAKSQDSASEKTNLREVLT